MAQLVYTRDYKSVGVSKREKLLMLEIGEDIIDSASSFVDYIADEYGISKSSIWYNLNCLKEKGVVDFADKLHQGEPLKLTKIGEHMLGAIEQERRGIMQIFGAKTEIRYAKVGVGLGGFEYPSM